MPPPIVTNFTCRGREMGFYADFELNCRVYHNCDDYGNKFTYYCPIDTAFRQEAMVCDHAHLVQCQRVQKNPPDNTGQSNFQQSEFTPFSGFQNTQRRSSSFSRSFRIGQDNPSNSLQNKNPNFVLSSSLFFGSKNDTFKKPANFQNKESNFPITKSPLDISRSTISAATNFPTTRIPSSTIRPSSAKSFTVKDSFNRSPIRDFDSDFLQPPPVRNDNPFTQKFATATPKPEGKFINFETQENKFSSQNKDIKEDRPSTFFLNREEMQVFPKSKSRPYMFLEPPLIKSGKSSSVDFTTKSPFDFRSINYPYMETLRSIQREARTDHPSRSTTKRPATTKPTTKRITESPFALLRASLKPLVPNEVEYDPYYPKFPTSTEIYYTPRDLGKDSKSSKLSTRKLSPDLHLRIPSVLPDLNSLEDLVDRRKIFYIPKSRSA